jgi:hypothetical protein
MGTKKGGARKGKPKGSRLAYDDIPTKEKKGESHREFLIRRNKIKRRYEKENPEVITDKQYSELGAQSLKRGGASQSGFHPIITALEKAGNNPNQAIEILLRALRIPK